MYIWAMIIAILGIMKLCIAGTIDSIFKEIKNHYNTDYNDFQKRISILFIIDGLICIICAMLLFTTW